MKTLWLLPLFVLGPVVGAHAASTPQSGAARATPGSAASTAPAPLAAPALSSTRSGAAAGGRSISLPDPPTEVSGYGEVEWIRTPRAQAQWARPDATEADSTLAGLRNEASSEWTVELSDRTFRQTLLRWTRIANWQLVWEVERDFAIDAQVTLNGNFLEALNQAMTSLRDTDYPVLARINPDTRVVRVVRYMLDGERR